MKLRDIARTLDNGYIALYIGYKGQDAEPDHVIDMHKFRNDRNSEDAKILNQYIEYEPFSIETCEEFLHVWIDNTKDELKELAIKLIGKLIEDEDGNEDMVINILENLGFNWQRLETIGLNVMDIGNSKGV